jgi:hypothetical protein
MAKKKTAVKKPIVKRKVKTNVLKKRPEGPAALKSPKTRRLAIHAFCRECIYDPSEPKGWRGQVENCTATDCPLYKFRPMSIGAERSKVSKKKGQS